MPSPSAGIAGEYLQAVWDASSDALALSDADGHVLAANKAYYELYGLSPEQVVGHDFAVMFPEAVREEARRAYRELFTSQDVLPQVDSEVQHSDGRRLFVQTRYTFIEEHGRRVAMVSSIRDVTALRTAEQGRTGMVLSLVHDLNSPLAVILAQAQLLARRAAVHEPAGNGPLTSGLVRIEAAVGRIRTMLGEMADTARLQSGEQLELQRGPVDLVRLARGCVETARQTTASHTLIFTSAAVAIVGEWDGQRLERVVDNLLSNAIKYSPNGGAIDVSLEQRPLGESAQALLRVEDRGIGIPAADLPHVFERFRRATNVSGRFAGQGLGLAGARRIVEQHGGSLTVSSVEGAGTMVEVQLPLAPVT